MGVKVTLSHVAQAQNSPQDFLHEHAKCRANVGLGPLVWDNRLAASLCSSLCQQDDRRLQVGGFWRAVRRESCPDFL